MELLTKTIGLADGRKITVCEADATFDARMAQIVAQANEAGEEDSAFLFFYRTFYPVLGACSRGDVPGPQEAYKLPDEKLDEWYRAAWKLNPDILGEFKKQGRREILEFRDGKKIVVCETQDLPSFVMRMIRLEVEEIERKDVPSEEKSFREYIYPKIAGCTDGKDIPSVAEAIGYPRAEIAKWSAVALELNPNWFQAIYDEAERLSQEKDKVKKKRSRRAHNKKDPAADKGAVE